MKTLSKMEYLKRWLKKGYSITQLQAIYHWKYTRLASGINRLRDKGWNIEKEMVKSGKTIYGKYTLKDENKNTLVAKS